MFRKKSVHDQIKYSHHSNAERKFEVIAAEAYTAATT